MAGIQAHVRVNKEYSEISAEKKDAGIGAELVNDDITHWKGTIKGPENTPYEGGTFVVDIRVPPQYPFVPPKMKFDTKIWHPNVSSVTGAICLDILKDQWSPALTMRTALLSLQALLSCPVPEDPQDAQVAGQYTKDFKAYEATAKMWTSTYAMPEKKGAVDGKLANLIAMGFEKEKALAALTKADGDENRALDMLFSG